MDWPDAVGRHPRYQCAVEHLQIFDARLHSHGHRRCRAPVRSGREGRSRRDHLRAAARREERPRRLRRSAPRSVRARRRVARGTGAGAGGPRRGPHGLPSRSRRRAQAAGRTRRVADRARRGEHGQRAPLNYHAGVNHSPVRVAAVRRVAASATEDSDLVAAEEPLHLELEHGPPGTRTRLSAGILMRTPGRDEDLATGLLFAEGLIAGAADIERMESPASGHLRISLAPQVPVDERMTRRVLVRSSACGVCGRDAIDDLVNIGASALPPGPVIPSRLLNELPAQLRARQAAFNETGGLHPAALFTAEGDFLAIAEYIGRHNAVDKLVGSLLRQGCGGSIMVVSGRAAFEIVHKAVRARVPVLAAVGAPSSLAVETGRAFNLTLAGFLRDDRFNVYSGFDRIV